MDFPFDLQELPAFAIIGWATETIDGFILVCVDACIVCQNFLMDKMENVNKSYFMQM